MEEGAQNAFGEKMHSVGARNCLEAVAKAIGWGEKAKSTEPHLRRGKGIALGNKKSILPSASTAIVKVGSDNTIELRCSSVDMGQGCRTIFRQMVADEFGVSLEAIRVLHPDTDITPYDQITASQRTTFNMGNAIRLACSDAKRQLFEISAKKLGVNPEQLDTRDFKVYVKAAPGKRIAVKELFVPVVLSGRVLQEGGEILGKATYYVSAKPLDPETGQGEKAATFYTFTGQAAEVEVNTQTGEVKVIRFATACDVGKAINPLMVEGQLEGGALSMGIGSALYEQIISEGGSMLNPNLADYKLPTVMEVPKIGDVKVRILETPHRDGPWGAKGVGEVALVVTAPAIGNAVYDAIGIRFKDLPITREKVLRALMKRDKLTSQ